MKKEHKKVDMKVLFKLCELAEFSLENTIVILGIVSLLNDGLTYSELEKMHKDNKIPF